MKKIIEKETEEKKRFKIITLINERNHEKTQFIVEDVFGDIISKKSISPEQIPKILLLLHH